MAHERLIAISYPAGDELRRVNMAVFGDEARVVFLQSLPPAQRLQAVRRAEVLIGGVLGRELHPGELEAAGQLRFIQLLYAGADSLDVAAIPDGVVIASNAGAYAKPIAEHVMAMALSLAKRLPQRHAALAGGSFDQQTPSLTLDGAVCAILGFGGIGKATARLMRAFGARICAINTSGRTEEAVEFAGTLADLRDVLTVADVAVIALPLTRATRAIIGRRELAVMTPAAILINVARAGILDERALYRHLTANTEFAAGIDVWWQEPRPGATFRTEYPFLDLPNVIGSPHNSGMAPGIERFAARRAAENVVRHLRGRIPVTGVVRREDYTRTP